jgi:hypothetical protein
MHEIYVDHGRPSAGIQHVVSVPTFGPKRKTILATTPYGVSLGTPLPGGGWSFTIIRLDGEIATAESSHRDDAVVTCCEQLHIDPVKFLGRAGVERVRDRRAA